MKVRHPILLYQNEASYFFIVTNLNRKVFISVLNYLTKTLLPIGKHYA